MNSKRCSSNNSHNNNNNNNNNNNSYNSINGGNVKFNIDKSVDSLL